MPSVRYSLPIVLVLACAGLSGAAALIYQVVWNRQFLTLFGSTTAATAVVVAAFMGGMALGARALSAYADRLRQPLWVYAGLELAIVLYALLFPVVLPVADALYAWLWQAVLDRPLALNGLRLALGLALLGPPTLAMGATLPLLVHIFGAHSAQPFSAVGWMYGVNALGGALGAAAVGLALIPYLGVSAAYGTGMLFGTAAAAGALFISRLHPEGSGGAVERLAERAAASGAFASDQARTLWPFILLLTGFAAMGYEVVWTRMLVLVTGSSTYAFTLMLAVYIAGLAAGSLWMANRAQRLRSPRLVFAHLQIGAAVSAAAGLWLFGRLPGVLLSWYGLWGMSFGGALAADALAAAAVVFVPTLLLGAAFPVAVRMARVASASPAQETGRVYAWMTAGNVLGVLAVSGLMIAGLGLQGTLLALAAIGLTGGLLCALMEREAVPARWTTAAIGALALMAVVVLQPHWDPVLMTSGIYKDAPRYLGLGLEGARLRNVLSGYRLLYYREGAQAVVSVVERPTLKRVPHLALAIDGKVDASTGADMSTQVLSGHLPLLAHSAPRRVLIIGLASGVTAGAVAQHRVAEQITVAEIEPAVVPAAHEFARFNHNALVDPRLRLVLDDGRHYLGTTKERFDIIISEPSNPWLSGPARLFTREFFETVRDRLNNEGIFAQWLPLYGLSTPLLKAEIRTFLGAFPHVALFQVSAGDVLLLGSAQPLHSWTDAALEPPVARDLARVGFDNDSVRARFITGEQGLAAWAGEGQTNTDDNGLLEFGAPRLLLADTLEANRSALAEAPWQADLGSWVAGIDVRSPAGTQDLLRLARAYLAGGRFDCAEFLASKVGDVSDAMAILGDVAAHNGDAWSARRLWQRADTPSALLRLVNAALEERNTQAADHFLSRVPVAARTARFDYLRGLTRMTAGADSGAFDALLRVPAETASGWQMLAAYLRGVLARRLAQPSGEAEALSDKFTALLDQLRTRLEREEGEQVMKELLQELEQRGPRVLAATEYRELQQVVRGRLLDPLVIYYRGVSLLWLGNAEEAAMALQDYLRLLPAEAARLSHANALLAQAKAQVSEPESNKRSAMRSRATA